MPDEPLLSEDDTAKLLKVARRTLQDWRFRGIGPRFVRMGRRTVRYRPQDVREYVEGGRGSEKES